ncbi:MAG: ribosome biogenesis GTPase YlqF, partial [Acholeplasmataceae bacterium]
MKKIQWFPGHMYKSLREIREKIKLMDIVFVLIDSRAPISSMNPEILKIVNLKPVLLLFNKIDLADPNKTSYFINHYEKLGFFTLTIDSQSGRNVNKIYPRSKDILVNKVKKSLKRGTSKIKIRAMILGIPNVGKSTLINRLVGKRATNVGDRPGVTKTQQWIKINPDFELLDTPGVLWHKFDIKEVAYNLAITGSIKDEILPISEVALYAITFLKEHYPKRLLNRYKLTDLNKDSLSILND